MLCCITIHCKKMISLPGEDFYTSEGCTGRSTLTRQIWVAERSFWNMESTVICGLHLTSFKLLQGRNACAKIVHFMQVPANGDAVYGLVQLFVSKSTCIGLFGKTLLTEHHVLSYYNCAIFASHIMTIIDAIHGIFALEIHVLIAILII